MTQAFRDHEIALMNPPYVELIDEVCGSGGHDLPDDDVYVINDDYYCSGCTREMLVKDIQNRLSNDLDEPTFDVVKAERCDREHVYRCECER